MQHRALEDIGRGDDDDEVDDAHQQTLGQHLHGIDQVDGRAELKAQEGENNGVAAGKHLADIHIHVAQHHAQDEGGDQRDDLHDLRLTETGLAIEAQEQQRRQQRHGADQHDAETGLIGLVAEGGDDAHVQRRVGAGDGAHEGQEGDAQKALIAEQGIEQGAQSVGHAQPHQNQQHAPVQGVRHIRQLQ